VPDTVPVPVPDLATVRLYWFRVKAAVTDFAAVMVTEQVPVPVQAPVQPVKVDPVDGAAVKVTEVLSHMVSVQSAPQSIPVPDTVPLPVPDLATVRTYWFLEKMALTDVAAVMVTVQVPVPVQAPVQPAKVEPVVAAAVKVTAVL